MRSSTHFTAAFSMGRIYAYDRRSDAPSQISLAQLQVPLMFGLDPRTQIPAHLRRPHSEGGVELVP